MKGGSSFTNEVPLIMEFLLSLLFQPLFFNPFSILFQPFFDPGFLPWFFTLVFDPGFRP